jgi:hypothetical protein
MEGRVRGRRRTRLYRKLYKIDERKSGLNSTHRRSQHLARHDALAASDDKFDEHCETK